MVLSIFVLVGCTLNNYESVHDIDTVPENINYNYESIPKNNEIAILLESSPHFRLYQTSERAGQDYRYDIFNSNGELVLSQTMRRMQPQIRYINDNVLQIHRSAGTGVWQMQFYSIQADMLSEVFESPFVITDKLIGYVRWYNDALSLVVQDLFDTEVYYNEFFIEGLERISTPINSIEYLGNNRIEVTYMAQINENWIETTTILEL